ncbi:hypothetical protein [Exiguobacterium sp. SH31]|nr:hypothetical protein [Exiguobacterium sp. SH31]
MAVIKRCFQNVVYLETNADITRIELLDEPVTTKEQLDALYTFNLE